MTPILLLIFDPLVPPLKQSLPTLFKSRRRALQMTAKDLARAKALAQAAGSAGSAAGAAGKAEGSAAGREHASRVEVLEHA